MKKRIFFINIIILIIIFIFFIFTLSGFKSNGEILDDKANEEIKYIMKKHKNNYSSAIHFSGLTIQPMARNLKYNLKYEKDRYKIQVKWYNISDDIIEVMAFYRYGRTIPS